MVKAVGHSVGGRKIPPLGGGHPPGIDESGTGGNGCEHEHPRFQVPPPCEERLSRRMQREQHGRGYADTARERQIPPGSTGNTRDGKRRCDKRRLLNSGDPPLRSAKLTEQAERKNHAEDRAPTDVEDLVAGLVDVAGEPVDEVDQPEVDGQRSEGDDERHHL